jgi:hypothetical protein
VLVDGVVGGGDGRPDGTRSHRGEKMLDQLAAR